MHRATRLACDAKRVITLMTPSLDARPKIVPRRDRHPIGKPGHWPEKPIHPSFAGLLTAPERIDKMRPIPNNRDGLGALIAQGQVKDAFVRYRHETNADPVVFHPFTAAWWLNHRIAILKPVRAAASDHAKEHGKTGKQPLICLCTLHQHQRLLPHSRNTSNTYQL